MAVVLPDQSTAPAEGLVDAAPRRRPRRRDRFTANRSRVLPYALLVPATAVLVVVLGYPLLQLVVMSAQEFGLAQQFGAAPEWVGLENFRRILGDSYFWSVLRRTLLFAAVNVALTMGLGTLIALLLRSLGRRMRTVVSASLLLAWAMPPLSATVVWQWLFDTQYGLVNWLLTELGGDFAGHSWLSDPLSFFFVATILVTWMGIPFVAISLHAGLTQIPDEVLEAAAIDGAGPWERFRDVVFPTLKPLFVILIALSTLWDLRVFTQIYVLQRAGGIARDTNLLGVWAYRISIGENRFDVGAAVALVMVAITILFTLVHVRQVTRDGQL